MKYLLTIGLSGIFLAGIVLADQFPAGNAENGRKVTTQCRTCHGLDGVAKIPIAPHIGGEPQLYLSSQLVAFRDGTRYHEMMSIVTKSLSDQQIADLAAWYSEKEILVELTKPENQAPEACVACHGINGIAVTEETPNLAGESNIYIVNQLKAFKNGKRTHEIMGPIAAELNDEDIRIAADWYGSIKFSVKKN